MDRRRQSLRHLPAFETFEVRNLLSMYGGAWNAPSRLIQLRNRLTAQADPPVVNNQVLNPTGVPTRHELLRTSFYAAMNGPFLIGPGRYSTEAAQIFTKGAGTSNTFLHGDYQLRVILPTDPTQPPTGVLTIFDRNQAAGTQLGLNLVGTSEVDAQGRPTKFTYTVNDGISGGLFTNASGEGTVELRYLNSSAGPSKGTAKLLVQGRVYTLGTTYSLSSANLG